MCYVLWCNFLHENQHQACLECLREVRTTQSGQVSRLPQHLLSVPWGGGWTQRQAARGPFAGLLPWRTKMGPHEPVLSTLWHNFVLSREAYPDSESSIASLKKNTLLHSVWLEALLMIIKSTPSTDNTPDSKGSNQSWLYFLFPQKWLRNSKCL